MHVSLGAGMTYYLNIYTKESQWDVPTEPAKPAAGSGSGGPDRVQCSHLLVKHAGSRRPSSWRQDNITIDKDEAMDILKGELVKSFFISFHHFLCNAHTNILNM